MIYTEGLTHGIILFMYLFSSEVRSVFVGEAEKNPKDGYARGDSGKAVYEDDT